MARRSLAALLTLTALALLAGPTAAQIQPDYDWTADRPDGVGPVGVVADRTYEPGDLNLSYRFVGMRWDGNRVGTNPISLGQVLDVFFAAPVQAEMAMHLFGVTYAPMKELTLEASLPFLVHKAMQNVTADGQEFEYDAGVGEDDDRYSFGDFRLRGHVPVYRDGAYRAHLTMGVSVPTGSFRQTDPNPLVNPTQVTRSPYPVQIGSGTWDILPGFTILAMNDRASTGIQVSTVARLHENELNYRLGHRIESSVWGAYRTNDYIGVSFRIHTQHWGDISGADPSLNQNVHPAANPSLQGGTRVDLPVGLNVYFRDGILEGHRLGFEASLPIYEDLHGPQLEHDWTITLGWQYLFEGGDEVSEGE